MPLDLQTDTGPVDVTDPTQNDPIVKPSPFLDVAGKVLSGVANDVIQKNMTPGDRLMASPAGRVAQGMFPHVNYNLTRQATDSDQSPLVVGGAGILDTARNIGMGSGDLALDAIKGAASLVTGRGSDAAKNANAGLDYLNIPGGSSNDQAIKQTMSPLSIAPPPVAQTDSAHGNPKAESKPDPIQAVAASVVTPPQPFTPPQASTDSAGYPDAPGEQAGVTYQEANPVGTVLFRDLPASKQAQILQQTTGVQNVPEMYDQMALARQSNPLSVVNSPQLADTMAMYGMKPSNGSTVNYGDVATQRGNFMQRMMSGNGQPGQNSMFTLRPDPNEPGKMAWVPTPEGNQIGPTGHPKYEEAAVQKAKDAYNTSHEAEAFDVTRTAWSQLASVAKEAQEKPNPSNDIALLKTFAKIDNPTKGVTEGNIETEMMNPGYFPGEVQQMWNHVTGGGILTPQQRLNIINAAKNSYKGNVASIMQYQNQTVLPQMKALLPTWRPEELAPAVFGNQPSMYHDGSTPQPGGQQQEQGNAPTVSTKADFDALPSGAVYIGKDGGQYMKP